MCIGNIIGAGTAAQGLDYQAQVQKTLGGLNGQAYDLSAASALDAGNQAAARTQMKGSQVIGAQRAAFGASGIDGSTGTPLEAMADSRMMSELDAATLRNNAARQAFGLKVQGEQARIQGNLDYSKLEGERTATLLTGFGQGAQDIVTGGSKSGLGTKRYG